MKLCEKYNEHFKSESNLNSLNIILIIYFWLDFWLNFFNIIISSYKLNSYHYPTKFTKINPSYSMWPIEINLKLRLHQSLIRSCYLSYFYS